MSITSVAVVLGVEAKTLEDALEQAFPADSPLAQVIRRCIAVAEIGAIAASTVSQPPLELDPSRKRGEVR